MLTSSLMDLLTYVSETNRRRLLADRLQCNPAYLWQIATGWKGRQASPSFARRIADATVELGGGLGGAPVPLHEIRPDIWDRPVAEQVA